MANKYKAGKIYIYSCNLSIMRSDIMPSNAKIAILQIIGYSGSNAFPSEVMSNLTSPNNTTIRATKLDGTYIYYNYMSGYVFVVFKVISLGNDDSVPASVQSYIYPLTALVALYKESDHSFKSLPCPSTYNGSTSTLVDSARNTKGYVVGQVVRSDIAKIEMTFNYLSNAQYAELAQMFEGKHGGSFFNKFLFFNATINNFEIREFYPSDRKFTSANVTLENGMPKGFTSVPLNLIEV